MDTLQYETLKQLLETIVYQNNKMIELMTEPTEDEENEHTTRNEQEKTTAKN